MNDYIERAAYPGFDLDRDWRKAKYTLDGGNNELRAITLTADATDDHDWKHEHHSHPWCITCEEYELCYATGSTKTNDLSTEAARHSAVMRVHRYLALHRNPPPDTYDPDEAAQGWDDQYLDADQLDHLPTPEPLIDGVLTRHSYAILRGRDGTYKSFTALDWALCLATGKPWQGHHAQQARALYIAGEGAYSMAQRLRAWETAWRTTVSPERFTLRQSSVNMRKEGPEFDDLLHRITEGGYGLVIVDTLRRASGGADENTSEMGTIVDNLERVKRATNNGSVLAIAHTGKADEDTRGFSGIEDDADIVWHAKRDAETDAFTLSNKKMKDGPDGLTLNLRAKPHGDSLIISAGNDNALSEDTTPSQRAILHALGDTFALTDGATASELIEVTGMSKSGFYKARAVLLRESQMLSTRVQNSTRYTLPCPHSLTESTPPDSPLTSDFPHSPHQSTPPGPVQSTSTPPIGVDEWTRDNRKNAS